MFLNNYDPLIGDELLRVPSQQNDSWLLAIILKSQFLFTETQFSVKKAEWSAFCGQLHWLNTLHL